MSMRDDDSATIAIALPTPEEFFIGENQVLAVFDEDKKLLGLFKDPSVMFRSIELTWHKVGKPRITLWDLVRQRGMIVIERDLSTDKVKNIQPIHHIRFSILNIDTKVTHL